MKVIILRGTVQVVSATKPAKKPVEVSSKDARTLISYGIAKDASSKSDDEPVVANPKIVEAIKFLDPEVEGNFTSGGKPECAALKELLGIDVSAAERDAAFKVFQEEQED